MPYTYGSSAGYSKGTNKTFEYLTQADNTGAVPSAGHILKYTRTETTTETVTSTFGAPTIGSSPNTVEVLSGTITHSLDEQLIEPATSGTAPPSVRGYNPRAEASVTVLGTWSGATFIFDSITFKVTGNDVAETSGDVVKTTLRGIAHGQTGTLTVGDLTSGGTIRTEKRFSNTDYVRTTATTVAFAGS